MIDRLRSTLLFLVLTALPAAAQDPPAPSDTTPPAPQDTAAAPGDAVAPVPADEAPSHDWEFSLAATDRSPGATGNVLVTAADGENDFVVVVSGLPPVDSLDQEGRDVAAYTVWVVPSKERVQESTLSGPITVDPTGSGRFEGSTELDTFGVIVLATAEEVTTLSGVPVLTGIPVATATPAAEPPAESPEAPPEAPEAEAPPEALEAEDPAEDPDLEPPADEEEAPPPPPD
jgi:hypothetical protein